MIKKINRLYIDRNVEMERWQQIPPGDEAF